MLWVYHLTCDGLRDTVGVGPAPLLSWRVGSDRNGAVQTSYRVAAVSMTDGEVCWDTGVVASSCNRVRYGGRPPVCGETIAWFVTITDDEGTVADSVPAAFVRGEDDEVPRAECGPLCEGCVWASDPSLGVASLDGDAPLDDPVWRESLGVSFSEPVDVAVPAWMAQSCGDCFVQGCALVSEGLLIVRWERAASASLQLTVPPGATVHITLPTETHTVFSGRHTFEM